MARLVILCVLVLCIWSSPLAPAVALSCEDPAHNAEGNAMLVRETIKDLPRVAVALDGIVTKAPYGSKDDRTGIVRPTRIWFGPKQPYYRLFGTDRGWGVPLKKGEHVRIVLYKSPPSPWLKDRLLAFVREPEPLYETEWYCGGDRSLFERAMRFPAVQAAVKREAERRSRAVAQRQGRT